MADVKISQLPSATLPLTGAELVPLVQGGVTKNVPTTSLLSAPIAGNLTFTGTGNRITGDFSNATIANRVMFQSSTTNGFSVVRAIPNGTSQYAEYSLQNSSDPAAASSTFLMALSNAEARFNASIANGGTFLPMTFYTGGSERVRVDTSGNVGVGVTPSAWASGNRFIDINASASYGAFGSSDSMMLTNAYWNGSNWIRKNANNAWRMVMEASSGAPAWTFQYAGNSTAGSTISWSEAMRIDSGNLLVGQTSTGAPIRFAAKGASTSSGDYTAFFTNSAGTTLGFIRNDGAFSTGVASLSPYNLTTGSAANVFVDSGGTLYRSTSSLKYKTDVKNATHGLAEVMALRPVTYKGKNNGDTVFGGLIAEEIHELGLTEFVQYAPDGSPDALHYGNMVSLAFKAIQQLKAEFDAYKATHP